MALIWRMFVVIGICKFKKVNFIDSGCSIYLMIATCNWSSTVSKNFGVH
jgi:hypothetical protein